MSFLLHHLEESASAGFSVCGTGVRPGLTTSLSGTQSCPRAITYTSASEVLDHRPLGMFFALGGQHVTLHICMCVYVCV